MENEALVPINSSADIIIARQKGRAMAMELGFDGSETTLISTAISEVARNIVIHAEKGEIALKILNGAGKKGVLVVASDKGPGIKDVARAMQYGYSTKNGLGVGLPGSKWLMDEFEIESVVGKGTTVTMKKWLHTK